MRTWTWQTIHWTASRQQIRTSPMRYSILSISSAPVYDLLCLVENNASDNEDLSRAIRASRHIRNLFPDVEVIQKMRLSRQRTEQIVVDYLFENTDFR